MSNSQFKRSEADHHNEMYAIQKERERLGLENWQDPKVHYARSPGKSQPTTGQLEDFGVKGVCINPEDLQPVEITPSEQSEAIQAVQSIDRGTRECVDNRVAVLDCGGITPAGRAVSRQLRELALRRAVELMPYGETSQLAPEVAPPVIGIDGLDEAKKLVAVLGFAGGKYART